MEGLPVNPLAVGLVGHPDLRVPGPALGAVDHRRHQHLAAVFGQCAGELLLRRESPSQPADLLGRLIGIRQGNHPCHRRPVRFQQQSLAENAVEHRPPHLVDAISRTVGRQCRIPLVAETLHDDRHARLDHSDLLQKSGAVRLDRCGIRLGRREVALPVLLPCVERRRDLSLDKPVRTVHHLDRQIAVPGQRRRVRQHLRLSRAGQQRGPEDCPNHGGGIIPRRAVRESGASLDVSAAAVSAGRRVLRPVGVHRTSASAVCES
jgi:hypothetical protein